MKLLIIVLSWIYLFLFVPSISKSQLKIDSTELSLALLEKEYFLEENIFQKNNILFQKGLKLKNLYRYSEAVETFNRIRPRYINDSLSFNLYYESAFCNYKIENYDKAQFFLYRLKNQTLSEEEQNRKIFLQILIFNKLKEWESASTLIDNFSYLNSSEKSQIKQQYKELGNLKLKDPEKAETLSSWLPGVGQMYAGKFWRGLTSSTIQMGLLGFAGYSFLNGYYFSGSLTGVSLFYVFYMGGARHAAYLATEYNKETLNKHLGPLEKTLFIAIKKGKHD